MADFSKESNNSTRGVELIAVVKPKNFAVITDKETDEKKPVAAYVDVMVNNSTLTEEDIAAGKGQANPHLYTKTGSYESGGKQKTSYENGIRFTMSQLETIEKAGGENTFVKEDGTKYIPIKADLMPLTATVKDKDGNPVPDPNDSSKNKQQLVGFMPNTKTVGSSELGKLTQERLDMHFANTEAVNNVKTQQKTEANKSKSAMLAASAASHDFVPVPEEPLEHLPF